MPIFLFNKLVRNKLPATYETLGEKITSQKLGGKELLLKLRNKLVEESKEIPFESGDAEKIVNELSDVVQVIDDIKDQLKISDEEIEAAKQRKLAKKGGFSNGIFVERIELRDDDEWVEYYRKEPLKYPEIDESGMVNPDLPQLEKGKYRHTKSGQLYDVIGVTFNTETYEPLVIYRPLYDHGKYELFARPYDMFVEMVELNGEMKPRFEKVVE